MFTRNPKPSTAHKALRILLPLACFSTANIVSACDKANISFASFYYMEQSTTATSAGDILKQKVDHLVNIGNKNKLLNYKITNKDVSIQTTKIGDVTSYDLSISIMMQYETQDNQYAVINTLQQQANAFSLSVSQQEQCP